MLIDLSVSLDNTTPVYPGDPPVAIQQTTAVEPDGYQLHRLELGTHIGTHIDAPAHMIGGGATLGALPLDTFVGNGVYIDARAGFDLAVVQAAAPGPADIVIFDTGSAAHYYEPAYFTDFPVMPQAVATYLASRNVKLVGLDTCSCDSADGFPIHHILLGAGIGIIENLTNLANLTDKRFKVYALPLKLNLDGAPARVIAEVSA